MIVASDPNRSQPDPPEQASGRASTPWRCAVRWTIGLTILLTLLNAGLFAWAPPVAGGLLTVLQFDGVAVRQGDWWRLVTGNFVHWSPAHFFLDLSSFLILGLLYERFFRYAYPLLLLVMAMAIGVTGLVCWPERTLVRGLSGVDWGLFAAGLCVELARSWHAPVRLFWVLPTAGIFFFGLIYQEVTGQVFHAALLGSTTDKLAPYAHLTGAVAAITFVSVWLVWKRASNTSAA
jgi:rhomboid family GlyGly-CTERM serine protease